MYPGQDRYASDEHGWTELLPTRQPRPALTGSHRVPWVVVGAGVTGLASARRLAELHPDEGILLLDARKVGQGASARSSGFAVAVSHFPGGFAADQVPAYARVNRINQAGLDLLRIQVKEAAIDCQWHEQGLYHTAADRGSIIECGHFLQYLDAMGIAHTPLDAEALSARLGTTLYQTGVHVHGGALLQPAALVRGLAETLPVNVTLYEQSPVLGISKGTALTLNLPHGEVQTSKLILATNYEAANLGFLRRRLVGSTLSGSFSRVLSHEELAGLGDLSEWGGLSLHGGGATVRLTRDRRLCLRNTAEFNGAALLSDSQLAKRQSIHRHSFERRFPGLAHVPFEFAWSGVEGVSRNATNFFGRQADSIYFAGGYNGSGISRGTAFGTALAEYASGGHSTLIDDCLACAPAAWLPPRPFLDLGAAFAIKSRFRNVGQDR
ncbi:MAG: FAD-dependent oxidoreductase [Rhodospirillaceae bacterium]|jgi:glycine/D-amino acid oxidase-like deaminating enzyme|nr:FAD-dependent oxidoreductase [Rhodospirillaceae bacterium]MBT4689388.1 FAD-dependent oxidoreductase [Rhodospirillaceae bacterium]MBT5081023.1 FAD-dependent oxidoreductase [Rhodospirillaceae bacterium]MBT5526166.1 FAD-dependent oxidoreductase [Rhodospirillaceae bacterium]MBT5879694.1 FAD-dependent oxidoreductase [Rhodospirillaceae bacterium]